MKNIVEFRVNFVKMKLKQKILYKILIKLTQDKQEKDIEGLKIDNLELNKQIKSLMDKQDNDKIENNKKMLNIS